MNEESAIELKKVISQTNESTRDFLDREVLKGIKDRNLRRVFTAALLQKADYDRALAVRLACEAVGGSVDDVIFAMASVECMDASVIIVDDIMDKTPRRMEKNAIPGEFGEDFSLAAAAMLKSMATNILIDYGRRENVDDEMLLKAVRILEQTHYDLYIGQYLDILLEEAFEFEDVSEKMYQQMIRYTTTAQLYGYFRLGGILGGGTDDEVKSLGQFGFDAGMIYQIRDDLNDYILDENLIHKTPLADFFMQKRRLPLLLAWNYFLSMEDKARLRELWQKNKLSPEEIADIIHLVIRPEVVERIKKAIRPFREDALLHLRSVKVKESIELLRQYLQIGCDL